MEARRNAAAHEKSTLKGIDSRINRAAREGQNCPGFSTHKEGRAGMTGMVKKITSLFSESLDLSPDFADWPADYPRLHDALDILR